MLLNACSTSENECTIVMKKNLVSTVDQWNFSTMKSCAGAKTVSETKWKSFQALRLSENSTNKTPHPSSLGMQDCSLGRGGIFLPEHGLGIQVPPAQIREAFLQIDVFLKGFLSSPWFAHRNKHFRGWKALEPFPLPGSSGLAVFLSVKPPQIPSKWHLKSTGEYWQGDKHRQKQRFQGRRN